MSKSIFISHAVKNKNIADKLVDLLETGVGISDSEIFCSSLEGLGIPGGTNFVEFIRKQIKDPKVVILLLSEDYFDSQFCLAELGASWILSHRVVPILVPPLEYGDVKAVLTGVQLLKINDSNSLNQVQSDLIEALGIRGKAFARWESKRNRFLDGIEEALNNLETAPSKVPYKKYDKVLRQYKDAVSEMEAMEGELEKKNSIINALKKAKDESAVKKVIAENSSDIERFEELASDANSCLSVLPEIVREAIFQNALGEFLRYPVFGENIKGQEIKEAAENDFLIDRGDGIDIVEDDPSIAEALKATHALSSFIEQMEQESEEFQEYYANTYDHRLNFKSRRFWGEHLL